MPTLKAHVEATNPERVGPMQTGLQAWVKHVLSNFTEYEFFCGPSFNTEGMVICCFYENPEDETPSFYFLKDGLLEEKY
jgi:hypothetical protein